MTAIWFVVAIVIQLATGGCERQPNERPNVLVVTVDTLRADALQVYGNPRPTSPFVARLASESVVFDHAYSSSSWTLPSLGSFLTARHPVAHAMDQADWREGSLRNQRGLPSGIWLLPEAFRRAGYRTMAIVANNHLNEKFGFSRGWDQFACIGFVGSAERLNQRLRDLLASESRESPWFIWLHYIDPHLPYTRHQPWFDEFVSEESPVEMPVFGAPEPYEAMGFGAESLEVKALRAAYESEVRYTDEAIEEAFRILGPLAADVVVISADHGEEFMEHGRLGHGPSLFEELIHIPLIIRLPEAHRRASRIERPVSLTDLGPSLLRAIGATGGWPETAKPFMAPGFRIELRGEPVLASYRRISGLGIEAIVSDQWKLLMFPARGASALFDLVDDPGERQPADDSNAEIRAQLETTLLSRLAEQRRIRKVGEQVDLTRDEIEQLRSLGYL